MIDLRTATAKDAEALTDLHLDVWDDAYSGLMPQSVLDQRRADRAAAVERRRAWLTADPDVWLAVDDGRLVGFANAGPARDDDPPAQLELKALYVRASHYSTGLGRRLLGQVLGDRPAYLWVLAGNVRAVRFYERAGFSFDGAGFDEPEGRHLRMVRT
ncbi:GNAT family N-acetyltransferase [Nocardioides acrostichi]|uniref:GNAT family N-acetyltransferase n=1 Tax=Nocardioides acrostichi TaxID=2784339 RepID=A0A930V1A8_9ACTN|nr:GNAT family N-acetyltransferase [Nocardioides acrostichi]MBF4163886.1 GNAT family N-acetyltransferase [Nocardioides acrostichi]